MREEQRQFYDLEDLRERREQAYHAGSPRSVERQHEKGKMLARERLDRREVAKGEVDAPVVDTGAQATRPGRVRVAEDLAIRIVDQATGREEPVGSPGESSIDAALNLAQTPRAARERAVSSHRVASASGRRAAVSRG